MKRRSALALATGVTIPALVFGFGLSSAQAETTDAATEAIITSALDGLGTEITDPALLDALQQDIATAVDEGIIDADIVDAAETADTALPELIDSTLAEQNMLWEEVAPEWAAAFEQIRTDFEACRTDGVSTSECARTLGFQLQLAHAEAKMESLTAAIAAVADLPTDEQEAALAELEAQRVQLEAQIERATTKLAAAVANGQAGATPELQAQLNAVQSEVRQRVNAPALPEQAVENMNNGTTNPAQGSGEQGGSANSNQGSGNSMNPGQSSENSNKPSVMVPQGNGNAGKNGR